MRHAHTPGPWTFQAREHLPHTVRAEDGREIAAVYGPAGYGAEIATRFGPPAEHYEGAAEWLDAQMSSEAAR